MEVFKKPNSKQTGPSYAFVTSKSSPKKVSTHEVQTHYSFCNEDQHSSGNPVYIQHIKQLPCYAEIPKSKTKTTRSRSLSPPKRTTDSDNPDSDKLEIARLLNIIDSYKMQLESLKAQMSTLYEI